MFDYFDLNNNKDVIIFHKQLLLKSDKDTILLDLKECQREKAGNNMETCAQEVLMQDKQADMVLGIYDKMMCNPGKRHAI